MNPLIAFIILLTVAVFGATAQAELRFGPGPEEPSDRLDTIVAVVNDNVITRGELNIAMAVVATQIRQRGLELPSRELLEQQVLERLILQQLQRRAAEENNVVVDDPTLNAAMGNIAQQNGLTLSQLRDAIERDGFSYLKFREEIRNEILTGRLRQRVIDSRIEISEQEVDNILSTTPALAAGDREFHIAQILIALPEGASPDQIETAEARAREILEQLRQGEDFTRLAVAVSDGRQALEGGDLGWRRVEQLPAPFANAVVKMEVGEVSEPIRTPSGFHLVKLLEVQDVGGGIVVQTRARHIMISTDTVSDEEARQQLLRLRERIVSGDSFAELARAHSNDTASAVRGGELGWISPGAVAPPFEQTMDLLQPGEISEPVKTAFGWHLIEVLERRQGGGADEMQRAKIREALFRRRSEEEWELWLRRLRDEAYVEIRL